MQLFIKSFLFQPLLNLFFLLILLYHNNIGLAVLTLAFLVRFFLWPGYKKAMINQRRLAKIQPKMKEIQARLKNDPVKANQEILQLFKKEKIQLSSFSFLLLQTFAFLFFFFFFSKLITIDWSSYLYSFLPAFQQLNYIFLGINLKMPNLPLVLISIAINIAAILMQPSSGQNKTTYLFLPFIILLFYQKIPAIIILFWIGTNLLGLIQDYRISRLQIK